MNISLLKSNGKFIGVSQNSKSYLLGFQSPQYAQHVQSVINDIPRVIVKKSTSQQNISREIKVALLKMDMPIFNVRDDIILDNEAKVGFQKQVASNLSKEPYEIIDIPYERFISLPFMNNFGIIMPYGFLQENDEYLLYKANVISNFYNDA